MKLCPQCQGDFTPFTPAIGTYACMKCLALYKVGRDTDGSIRPIFLQVMKRIGPNDWLFGGNNQLKTNLIWAEAMEVLYESWIAKQIVS